MPALCRAVITGAPGGGKTSLLAALDGADLVTSGEVARTILRQPGGMELRANDPEGFALAMLDAQMAEYRKAGEVARPMVFDRGFPDIVGFLKVSGLDVPDAVDRACRDCRFSGPIFRAPAWREIYHPDAERIQNWDEAVASDEAVTSAWRDYGYAPVDLPLKPLSDRVAFIRKRMALPG